ncbi:MAG: hypothetical protein JWQ74_3028 [Marmoricola sp.]|nr:hypothetical protein [Marmoricola sp.]
MMRPARRLVLACGTALLLLAPLACGNQYDDYCAALKKDAQIFSSDGVGNLLIADLPKLQALGAKAPDDLQDEWQTFLTGLGGLSKALAAAGVKAGEFSGTRPADVTDAEWSAIQIAANNASSDDVAAASDGIDQQARDVCKLQLGF